MLKWSPDGGGAPSEGEASLPNIEDVMVMVAAHIESKGGQIRTRPGQLIKEIAEAIYDVEIESPYYLSREYHSVSRALIALEEAGWVLIERAGWHRSERANKLIAVRLITD